MDKNMKKICRKCFIEKDITEFSKRKNVKDNLYSYCKKCHYLERQSLKKKHRANGECINCGVKSPGGHQFCADCKIKTNTKEKQYYDARREKILNNYGRICACCGEANAKFLALDHVNNDGNVHRKTRSAASIYRDVIEANYPNDFQLLCTNCNFGKQTNKGTCPGRPEDGHHGAWKAKETSLWDLLKVVQDTSKTAIGE